MKPRIAIITTNKTLFERYCTINGLNGNTAKWVSILRDVLDEVFLKKVEIEGSSNVTDKVKRECRTMED